MGYHIMASSGKQNFVEDSAGTQYFSVWRDTANTVETVYVSTFYNWNGSGVRNNNDYQGFMNVPLTFQVGEYFKGNPVSVYIRPDDDYEPDETFGVVVHTASGQWLAWTTFTIVNDDSPAPPPKPRVVNFQATSTPVEGQLLEFRVELDRPVSQTTKVYYSVIGGSAENGDYLGPGYVSFSAGSSIGYIYLSTFKDSDYDDETVTLQLNGSPDIDTGYRTATGTILDNDTPPPPKPDLVAQLISLTPTALHEGDDLNVTYRITNQGPGAVENQSYAVAYISPDPNFGDGNDIALAGDVLATGFLGVGQSVTQTITVSLPDALSEGTWYLAVMADAINNRVDEGSNEGNNWSGYQTITVSAPDPVVSLSVTKSEATEGDAPLIFEVNLDRLSAEDIIVSFQMGGTADSSDYVVKSGEEVLHGSVRIQANSTTAYISVYPLADADGTEGDETVTVTLTGVSSNNATLGPVLSGSGIIHDGPPTDDYADHKDDATAPVGVLPVGGSLSGMIGEADEDDAYGDKDVFRVSLEAGKTYRFTLQGDGNDPLPIGIFTIRDSAFVRQAISPEGSQTSLVYTASYTGDHYIRVGAGGVNFTTTTGGYRLSVQDVSSQQPVPIADAFRHPLGNGFLTEALPRDDGVQDGYYSAQDFGDPYYNKYGRFVGYHLAEDWNGAGGGDTDLGDPVYAAANGRVVYAQDAGYGWGKVVMIEHVLPTSEYGGKVTTMYAHLDNLTVAPGDIVHIGQQIATIGKAPLRNGGYWPAHLHFEVRSDPSLGLGTGYSTTPRPSGWLDPTDFINAHRGDQTAPDPSDDWNGDDYGDTVLTTGRLSVGGSAIGVIEISEDRDWFAIDFQKGNTYRIAVTGKTVGGHAALEDTFFTVRDDAGNRLTGKGSGAFSYDDVDGRDAVVEFTAPYDGRYFIAVGSGDPDNAAMKGGYEVSVVDVSAQEPGDDKNTARVIEQAILDSNGHIDGFVGFGEDSADFFKLQPKKSGELTITLSGLGSDIDLIVDEVCPSHRWTSKKSGSSNEKIHFYITQGAEYYVKILPYHKSQSSYTLSFKFVPDTGEKLLPAELIMHGHKVQTMARFTMAAYEGGSSYEVMNDLIKEGWRFLTPQDLKPYLYNEQGQCPQDDSIMCSINDVYFKNQNAAAIVARAADALVLAFRGTDDSKDVYHWTNMDKHYNLLSSLISAVENYAANNNIHKLYVTGHSLGSAMVDKLLYTHKDNNEMHYEAFTFAHPDYNISGVIPESVSDMSLDNAKEEAIKEIRKHLFDSYKGIMEFGKDDRVISFHVLKDPIKKVDFKTKGLIAGDNNYLDVDLIGDNIKREDFHSMKLYLSLIESLNSLGFDDDILLPYGLQDVNYIKANLINGNYIINTKNNILYDNKYSEIFMGGYGNDTYKMLYNGGDDWIADAGGEHDTIFFDDVDGVLLYREKDTDLVIRPYKKSFRYEKKVIIKNYFTDMGKFGGNGEIEYINLSGEEKSLRKLWEKQNNPASPLFDPYAYNNYLVEPNQTIIDGGVGFDRVSYENIKEKGIYINSNNNNGLKVLFIDQQVHELLPLNSGVGGGVQDASAPVADGQLLLNIEEVATTNNDDIIKGNDLDNVFDALAGDDQIEGRGGDDIIQAGDGDDIVSGGEGADTLYGQQGNDSLQGGLKSDTIFGGGGEDTVFGGPGADRLYGNADDDVVHGGADEDFIHGGAGKDILYGDAQADELRGGDNEDLIWGGGGNDTLYGDGQKDILHGGNDADQLWGGGDDDVLFGEGQSDILHGGANNDTLWGGGGADTLYGDDGEDILHGGLNDDTLWGGGGDDALYGEGQNDLLRGGDGQDVLWGGGGNDTLYGDAQDDALHGGLNDDVLIGGKGNDRLWGGGQKDTFVYRPGFGTDKVMDFQNNVDLIDLTSWGFATLAEALGHATQVGAHVKFDFSNAVKGENGDQLWIYNITLAQLANDIIV